MKPPPSHVLFEFGATAPETVAMAKTFKVMLTNHTHPNLKGVWPAWMTSLDTLGEGADALDAAFKLAANKGIMELNALEEQHLVVKKQMTQIARYVDLAVDGNRDAIKEGGIPVRSMQPVVKASTGLPPAPDFAVVHGEETGTFIGKTPRYNRAKTYRVRFTEADPSVEANYQIVDDFPLASKMIMKGYEPGKLYWFQACILSSAGRGPWSKPVSIRCL